MFINIFYVLMIANISFPGGDADLATVERLYFDNEGYLNIEIEWINTNGFLSQDRVTKLSFRYNQVKNYKLLSFFPRWGVKKNESKDKKLMSACLNYILKSFKDGNPILIGQIGTERFKRLDGNSEIGAVSFAELKQTFNKEKGCFLYASH